MPLAGQSFVPIEGVGKTYRSLRRHVRAVVGVTLGIERGEVFGLVGPSGAGKSTLIALSLGFLKPSRGWIRVAESRCASSSNALAWAPSRNSW